MDIFAFITSLKTVAPIEAANKEYLALEIQPGGKYVVNFNGGKKYYLAISEQTIKPMFNNPYYGVVLVITDPNPTHRNIWVGRLYIRGNAVVLCDKPGERFITNCGEDSDYFYTNTSHGAEEREMPKEDYLDILRRHFKKLYLDYWVENPEQWEKMFNGMVQKIRPLKYEDGKILIV